MVMYEPPGYRNRMYDLGYRIGQDNARRPYFWRGFVVGTIIGAGLFLIVLSLTSCALNPGGGNVDTGGGYLETEICQPDSQPAPWLSYSGAGTMHNSDTHYSVYFRYPHDAPWATPGDSTSVLVLNAHNWSAYRLSFRGTERRLSYGRSYLNAPEIP